MLRINPRHGEFLGAVGTAMKELKKRMKASGPLAAGSGGTVPKYHPTVNYGTCHVPDHTDNPFSNGPGGGVANLIVRGSGAVIFAPLLVAEAELALRVVEPEPGDVLYFTGRFRTEWSHGIMRHDLRGAPEKCKKNHATSRMTITFRFGDLDEAGLKTYLAATASTYGPGAAPKPAQPAPTRPSPAKLGAAPKPAQPAPTSPSLAKLAYNQYWAVDVPEGKAMGRLQPTSSIKRRASGCHPIRANTSFTGVSSSGAPYEAHILQVGRFVVADSVKRAVILRYRPLTLHPKSKTYRVTGLWSVMTVLNAMQVLYSICLSLSACFAFCTCLYTPACVVKLPVLVRNGLVCV